METSEFKKLFAKVATQYGFDAAFGGWSRQTEDGIVVLDLQKSKNGPYFDLNIKIFVQGMFSQRHTLSQSLVKKDIGTLMTRQPVEYNKLFQMDAPVSEADRRTQLDVLFREYIDPLVSSALSQSGLRDLVSSGKLFALPAVRQALGL